MTFQKSSYKRLQIVLFFTIFSLFSISILNNGIISSTVNSVIIENQIKKSQDEFNSNFEPKSASSQTFDRILFNQNPFTSDPTGTGSLKWTDSGTYVTYSSNRVIMGTYGISTVTLTFNANFLDGTLGYKAKNAYCEIDWEFIEGDTTSWVKFQYSKDGGSNWQNIYDRPSAFDKTGTSKDIFSLLSACNIGQDDNSLIIRIQAYLNNKIGENARVNINGIKIGIFECDIADNANGNNMNNFSNGLQISINLTRWGGTTILAPATTYYRVYYNLTGGDITSNSDYWVVSGGFSLDTATFTVSYTITQNYPNLKYRFCVIDATGGWDNYYWATQVQLNIYDGFNPSLNLNSVTNPSYDKTDFKITGTITDTGGSGFKNISIYWGYNSGITNSSSTYNYSSTLTTLLSGNVYEFPILEQYLSYNKRIYYRLYSFDNANNMNLTSEQSFIPIDDKGPTVTIGTSSVNIGYRENKTIVLTITEPEDASGLNISSPICNFTVNNPSMSAAIPLLNISQTGDIWTYLIESGNFSANALIRIWVSALDKGGTRTVYPFTFTAVDSYAPLLQIDNGHTKTNLSQTVNWSDLGIVINSSEENIGSGIDYIQMAIKMGSAVVWNSITQKKYNATILSGDQYFITIPRLDIITGVEYFYTIRVYDKSNNYNETTGSFYVTSGSSSNPTTTNTDGTQSSTPNTDTDTTSGQNNNPPKNNGMVYAIIGVGLGIGAISIVLVKKSRSGALKAAAYGTMTDGVNKKAMRSNDMSQSSSTQSKWSTNQWDSTPTKQPVDQTEQAALPSTTADTNSEDSGWEDMAPTQETTQPIETPSATTPLVSAASTGTIGVFDPIKRMSPEMLTVYNEAQEFLEMGQDSMAVKSFDVLLRMVEKQHDAQLTEFLKQKMDQLYQ